MLVPFQKLPKILLFLTAKTKQEIAARYLALQDNSAQIQYLCQSLFQFHLTFSCHHPFLYILFSIVAWIFQLLLLAIFIETRRKLGFVLLMTIVSDRLYEVLVGERDTGRRRASVY